MRPASTTRRGPALKQDRNGRRAAERNDRIAWYLYEYGRTPTIEELAAIRDYLEETDPRYYPPNKERYPDGS